MNTQPVTVQVTIPPQAPCGQPAPAGLSSQCDCWIDNPRRYLSTDPLLIQCPALATRRITLSEPDRCYTVKRCNKHAIELRRREANGGCFEILSDEPIGAE